MDRRYAQYLIDRSPVRAHRFAPIKLLLHAADAKRFNSHTYEESRRDLYREAVLRLSEDQARAAKRRTQRQSKTSPGDHAGSGPCKHPTRPQHVEEPPGTSQIPVSLARLRDHRSARSVEHRHHVHSAAKWLCLPGCGNRLGSVD